MEIIGNIIAEKWKRIAEEIASGKVQGAADHRRFECPDCFNSGFRYVRDPQPASDAIGVVRCDRCRYWEFHSMKDAA